MMQNSFISLITKAVTNWKIKDGRNKDDKIGINNLNYYDAVCSPDLSNDSQDISDKTSLMKNSMKDEMSAFFLETSFTALTQIYKANSTWKRVVWTIVVIGMLALMAVQCYWLLDKYYNYPIEVKMDMKVSTVLEFPSVTICNLNPIMEPNVLEEPYTALAGYVNPKYFDLLFKETLENWQFEDVCTESQFKCNDGRCLFSGWACDGWPDCKDGEDEAQAFCENFNCSSWNWKCTNPPKCINIMLRCNGRPGHCNENTTEDEDNCQNNTCSETFFRCSSGMCIPRYYVCDSDNDCGDDEVGCPEVKCIDETVKCNNTNRCILTRFLCDGDNDCRDYEDESNCDYLKGNTTMGYEDFNTENATSLHTTTESSSRTMTQTRSVTVENTTAQPSITTDTVRKKREAPSRPFTALTKETTILSKDKLALYKDYATGIKRPVPESGKNNILRDIRTKWEATSGSDNREDFINELYDSYIEFQTSEILKLNQRKKNGYKEENHSNEAHHRVKRQSRPSESPKNSTSLKLDWTAILENSTFNKWNMLGSAGLTSNFYEERDDEYEASMTYAYITATLDPDAVEKKGHVKIDLIAACKFGGYQCSPANFSYFHSHKYGNCYTFNSKFSKGPLLTTRFPGPENGLRLELFLDQKNYVANLATEAGIRVLVHKKGSMPFPEDEGISVMPGRSTSVGIRQVSFTRLPPPHGTCGIAGMTTDYYGKYFETDYSKLACLKSCYQDLILKYCNCAVPFYYVFDNVTVCNMTDITIEHCVTNLPNIYSERYEICDKMCPVPCTDTRYEMSISSAKWPSEKYQIYLQQRLSQTNAIYRQAQDSDNEFTKLQIYFQDLIYEHVEQQKAYEGMNLISDLGGQLGLWLGLSAITIGEICSFLFGVSRSLSYKCWGNKTNPIRNDLTPITNIEPATLQEMYEDLCPEAAKYIPPDMIHTLPGSTYA